MSASNTIDFPRTGPAHLSRSLTLDIIEQDAAELVSRDIFDEVGNITGQMPEEDYAKAIQDAEGMSCFSALGSCEGKQFRARSAIVPVEMRGAAMSELFAYFGHSVFREFFAEK